MAEEFEPAPDPEGEKPEGWGSAEWIAYVSVVGEGTSQRYAADLAVKSRSWVASRVYAWRRKYGEEVVPVRSTATKKAHGEEAVVRREVDYLGRMDMIRASSALKLATGAQKGLAVVEQALEELYKDPERIRALTPKELLDLTRAACLLSARSEGLRADILVQTSGPEAPLVPGLEDLSVGPLTERDSTAMSQIKGIISDYEAKKQNVIEATASE